MDTKITLIYNNPVDEAAFEAGYQAQFDLASALPGLTRIETSKVWPKEDGTPTPAYRMVDLYFPDYATASAAVTTAQAGELFANVQTIASAGLTILFADVERDQ